MPRPTIASNPFAAPRPSPASQKHPDLPTADLSVTQATATLLPPIPSESPESSPAEPMLRTLLDQLPARAQHFEGITEEQSLANRVADASAQALVRERIDGSWYAAAVETDRDQKTSISLRFQRATDLDAFVKESGAIIETWIPTPEAPKLDPAPAGRRLMAHEVTAIRRQERETPTFSVLVYPDPQTGHLKKAKLEFGLQAAESSLLEQQAYRNHRLLQVRGREILSARNPQGWLSANAQWRRLQNSVHNGQFEIVHLPAKPASDSDFFVAIEYAAGHSSNFTRAIRCYRRGEIIKDVIEGVQLLTLRPRGTEHRFHAVGFKSEPMIAGMDFTVASASLVPAIHPVAGQDVVDMRVFDPAKENPQSWNILDFGEPEIVRQRGLASYGLLQGYLEKKKKSQALRKSRIDLFVEPVILGLNIGGGAAGVSAPLGDGARLAYNVLVAPAFLERVPKCREYPALLTALASGSDPANKLQKFFGVHEVASLTDHLTGLNPAGLHDVLHSIDDDDLRAMSKLSRGRSIDERYRLLADVATGIAAVTESTDSGASQTTFDNGVLALNGDFSLKNSLALAFDKENLTPKSDYSLEDLLDNQAPSSAWWQFLDLSVDLRAVVNSLSLVRRHSDAERLLRRPFPHSPLLSDLAAYEVRGFGFPAFIYYKRKLIKEDAEAFATNYAYGVVGTRVVERFPDQYSFVEAIRTGRITALGFVQVRDGDGNLRSSDLPVFSYRIAGGKHDGKLALVMFGLQAFAAHAEFVEREHQRFRTFQSALLDGGVIETPVPDPSPTNHSSPSLEPAIFTGAKAVELRYHALLNELLEYHRFKRLEEWNVARDPADTGALPALTSSLRDKGVVLGGARSPLISLDSRRSRFVFLRHSAGGPRKIVVTLVPSIKEIDHELNRTKEKSLIESYHRQLSE